MPPNTDKVRALCTQCETVHIVHNVAYDDRMATVGDYMKYEYDCPYCDEETRHIRSQQR